jgi:hypothetical protein
MIFSITRKRMPWSDQNPGESPTPSHLMPTTMIQITYAVCALASVLCAALLFQEYLARQLKVLMWATLCFMGLAVNNILVFIDNVLLPKSDLFLWRAACALAGMTVLIYGLIWDSK